MTIKTVENRKEVGYNGVTIYTMDRIVCGKKLRQAVAFTKFDMPHRVGIARRLRHARQMLRRSCEFVRQHQPRTV